MTAISVSERLLEMAAFYTPLALTVTKQGVASTLRTVFLAMKKGRQMPPLAFEILCVSETPRYGKVKSPRICRL